MNTQSARLLQLALPLVKTHGFTRTALARAVLELPQPHAEPLPDAAVTALFGHGDNARRTLIRAWLDDACCRMEQDHASASASTVTMRDVLHARLRMNEPVLGHLAQGFALLSTSSRLVPLPPDPLPVLEHAARVADQACWIAEPDRKEMAWYTRRATVSGIYLAAELHQLTSPSTAASFLDHLVENSAAAEGAVREVSLYGSYILSSWKGITKSLL
ncbi:hypothetical protein JVT61DRAFT_4387 [Boletus reticuloceps]|uniref:COQ9 C-terminal domain-containing protein n=1 Tax=Boletus reticuloceps TaxID=495285 RepID=A0A8I3A798_9AGAM|nr:hypothetical protein JVT61DRAFT_4387 [Boletus reticuloceps]